MAMEQLVFDLAPAATPTFENFICGRNAELLGALKSAPLGSHSCIYLWGAPGSGKTHLLQAAISETRERGFSASYFACSAQIDLRFANCALTAIDDVELLGEEAQIGLLSLYLREAAGVLIASGPLPPARLALRRDLATRLGSGLVYQVHAIDDEEKSAALRAHAAKRGFALSDEVLSHLLNHGSRDLSWLLAMVNALDRYSLSAKRTVTVPLLKELWAMESAG
jgi:DnaA-homolog protein